MEALYTAEATAYGEGRNGEVRSSDGVIDEVLAGGTTVLLVEQNARRALQAAQEGHILQNGEIVRSGASETLLTDDDIIQAYLGTGRAKE